MNEKVFKTMTVTGVANVAIGIVLIVVGLAAGIIAIMSGARLIKDKNGLTF